MAFGIGGEAKPGLGDGAMLADRGQHILQGPPLGRVVEYVAGREQLEAGFVGDPREAGQPPRVVAAIEMVRGEIGAAGEISRDPLRARAVRGKADPVARVGWQQDDHEPRAMGDDVRVIEVAFALWGTTLAEGQQRCQPAIGGAVLGKREEAHAVAQIEPHADDQANTGLFRRLVRTDDAGDAVAVGDGDRRETERGGLFDQLVRMRAAAQKREIAGDL